MLKHCTWEDEMQSTLQANLRSLFCMQFKRWGKPVIAVITVGRIGRTSGRNQASWEGELCLLTDYLLEE